MVDIVFVLTVIAIGVPLLKWLATDEDNTHEPPHFPSSL